MFYSHQNNDFWDRPIVFSPKRIVRVLTICVLVTLSLFTVLWIAPGRRPSRTLAPLQDKAADSTSHSSSQDNSLKELQYPSTESTNLKEPSYSSSKSSDLEEYPHSRESSDLKEASYPEEKSVSKEKTKSSHNLASLADSGTQATFTKTPYPPSLLVMTKNTYLYVWL
ncbi:hypothetical protein HO173_011587 [Letharia columbiana]|uniref:Uncharacterized protein n=1 Tax=Letharia columbiana TaxID=112416 RepID=A0A8H6FJ40_9LECA|nr:uncharacterized protein HO173_011587 [Letharia columbiana]KAF6229460.1 hypothetical protein HO173_011587 [Letharia columbiana]